MKSNRLLENVFDYTLRNRILSEFSGLDNPTINNAFSCLVEAENLIRSTGYMVDHTAINAQVRAAVRGVDRAAQYVWGNNPPKDVVVNDVWHYNMKEAE